MITDEGFYTSDCRSCGAAMIWVVTARGKKMPVDAEQVSRATAGPKALLFSLERRPGGDPLARLSRDPDGYVAHFATCPEAKRWSRERGEGTAR